jgi:DNA-binding HxlR family transcriptional regulator
MIPLKKCPIEVSLQRLSSKWTIQILRDLFRGSRRFSDFLKQNPKLSTRVLSQRLCELENDGLIAKKIVSKTPLKAEYELTGKGLKAKNILCELARFGAQNFPKEVFIEEPEDMNIALIELRKLLEPEVV